MPKRKITYEGEPEYGQELTLAELKMFAVGALGMDVPPDTKVRVRVNFSGGLRKVSVTQGETVRPRPNPS